MKRARLVRCAARYFAAVDETLRISWVAINLVLNSETKSSMRSSKALKKRAVESVCITVLIDVILNTGCQMESVHRSPFAVRVQRAVAAELGGRVLALDGLSRPGRLYLHSEVFDIKPTKGIGVLAYSGIGVGYWGIGAGVGVGVGVLVDRKLTSGLYSGS